MVYCDLMRKLSEKVTKIFWFSQKVNKLLPDPKKVRISLREGSRCWSETTLNLWSWSVISWHLGSGSKKLFSDPHHCLSMKRASRFFWRAQVLHFVDYVVSWCHGEKKPEEKIKTLHLTYLIFSAFASWLSFKEPFIKISNTKFQVTYVLYKGWIAYPE